MEVLADITTQELLKYLIYSKSLVKLRYITKWNQ